MSTTDLFRDPDLTGTAIFTDRGIYRYRNGSWSFLPPVMGGAEGDDPADDGDPTGGDDPKPDDEGNEDPDPKDDDEKKFTQKEVNAIAAREASKASRGKVDLKELGFKNSAELKQVLDGIKAKEDADKDEATKEREEAVEAAKKEATEGVLSTANERIVKSEFILAAIEAKLDRKAMDDALVLAKTMDIWEGVEIDEDGKVSGFDEDFFKTLKEEKPFLFKSESDDEDDEDDDAGGGAPRSRKTRQTRDDKLKETYPALQGAGIPRS